MVSGPNLRQIRTASQTAQSRPNSLKINKETTHDLVWWTRRASTVSRRRATAARRDTTRAQARRPPAIAKRCLGLAKAASAALNKAGIEASEPAFDTIVVKCDSASIARRLKLQDSTWRVFGPGRSGTVVRRNCYQRRLSVHPRRCFWRRERQRRCTLAYAICSERGEITCSPTPSSTRTSPSRRCCLLKQLEDKDLALNHSMISLGADSVFFSNFSELEVRVDGVNATRCHRDAVVCHRDAVGAALRESREIASGPRNAETALNRPHPRHPEMETSASMACERRRTPARAVTAAQAPAR